MEENEIHPETNYELKFRIYRPESDDLQKYAKPIDPYPTETINQIDEIIKKAKQESPDKPDTKINFSSHKRDADLKRMMQPEIDELREETLQCLRELRR